MGIASVNATQLPVEQNTTADGERNGVMHKGGGHRSGHRNFNAHFKKLVTRNLAFVSQQVDKAGQTVSDDLSRQVLHTLNYALSEPQNWTSTSKLLFAVAPKMEWSGYRLDWIPFLKRGLALSVGADDAFGVAKSHFYLGVIQRMISAFALATQHLEQSIAKFEEIGDKPNLAASLNELAWVAQLQHQYGVAIRHANAAAELLTDDQPELAVTYRVKGMIAIGYQQWEEAQRLHEEALRRFRANNDARRTAWSIQNIGYALHGQGRYKEAIDLYQQALVCLEDLGDHYHRSIVQANLGIAYHNSGELEQALAYNEAAIETINNLHDKLQLAKIECNTGLVYLGLNQYTKAKACFERSSNLHESMGNTALYINAQDGLAMTYLAQENYQEAKIVLDKAIAQLSELQDSPHYAYLNKSLREHLQQAVSGNVSAEDFYLF